MSERFSTPDIWLGSVFLSETDAELVDVQYSRNGRETVMFCFVGEDLSRMTKAYYQQQVLANVTQLREKLNTLRDHIFQARQKV